MTAPRPPRRPALGGDRLATTAGATSGRQRRRRVPAAGPRHADAAGHATDWTSLNDGTMDALQYYSVGVGRDRGSAGGQRRPPGQRRLDHARAAAANADRVMGSNFGGDGGDTIAEPAKGCDSGQEYVYLEMRVTNNCAVNDGSWRTT